MYGELSSLFRAVLAVTFVSGSAFALELPDDGPTSQGACISNLDCTDNDPCTFDLCDEGVCENFAAAFGDLLTGGTGPGACRPDGHVSNIEIVGVVLAFEGSSYLGCDLSNFDLGGVVPCQPDGVIDVYDFILVLDAFTAEFSCCNYSSCSTDAQCDDGTFCNGLEFCDGVCRPSITDCPGQACDEDAETCVDSNALLSCRFSDPTARPGANVTVEFFIEDVVAVRGLQASFQVTRTSGSGDLIGSIDQCYGGFLRDDFVFGPGAPVRIGKDTANLRVATAQLGGDRTIDGDPALFASFEFEVSDDAVLGSTFELSISDGPGTLLLGPVRNAIGFSIGDPCAITVGGDCDNNAILDHCDLDCGTPGGDCDVVGCGNAVDCNENSVPDTCDVTRLPSNDWNENGVPDSCDIDRGAADCDQNNILDACDIASCVGSLACGDCNDNGVPDACDIAAGTSIDDDDDGLPDECTTDERALFLTALGRNPTTALDVLTLRPGRSYVFDVWVRESVVPLTGYDFTLDDASGGDSGSLFYDGALGIDQTRPDWVYSGGGSPLVSVDTGPPARLNAALNSDAQATVVNGARYCGHLSYTATADACGTFSIGFSDPGTSKEFSQTILIGLNDTFLEFDAVTLTVNIGPGVYGNIDGYGGVDLFDIFSVLDAFTGDFGGLLLEDVDIAPCGGDRVIDLLDIFAVLDAFSGQPAPCSVSPCGE